MWDCPPCLPNAECTISLAHPCHLPPLVLQPKTSHPHAQRSVVMCEFGQTAYVFCGLGDGNLVNYKCVVGRVPQSVVLGPASVHRPAHVDELQLVWALTRVFTLPHTAGCKTGDWPTRRSWLWVLSPSACRSSSARKEGGGCWGNEGGQKRGRGNGPRARRQACARCMPACTGASRRRAVSMSECPEPPARPPQDPRHAARVLRVGPANHCACQQAEAGLLQPQ